MPEEIHTSAPMEPSESEIQTIPPEFYGGLKKALPKQTQPANVLTQSLVAQARKAPSPANVAPQNMDAKGGHFTEIAAQRFSLKMVLSVSGGVFALLVGGISYYYINQSRVIKEGLQSASSQNVAVQQTEVPLAAVTSTVEAPTATSTASSPALQPLSGVIFPLKTYTQTADIDNDGLTDIEEILYGTDPEKPDSDGDGYIDGLEVHNLYNPLGFKPVRLIDSGHVSSYVNPTRGYSIYYPNLWTAQSLDSTNEQVLFSSGNGAYIEVIHVENPLKLSILDWYKGQSPGTEISSLKTVITKDKVEGVLSPDGLTAYLPFDTAVYVISYNIGLQDQVSFLETFSMMVNSFRHQGITEQSSASNESTSFAAPAVSPPPFAGTSTTSP